ncbi:MAG: MFS transporter [Dokdonella sp.]
MSETMTISDSNAARGTSVDGFWLYLLFALLATAGFFYINIMSAIVDGLITGLGFSNAQAGMVGSANIYGASIGSLCAVFIVRRIEWRPALVVLFSLLIAIDLASSVIHDPNLLIAVRAMHGFIGGMSVGIAYSVMARLHSPDRAFGVLLVLQFGLGGLGVMYLPLLVPLYGAQILFFVLAALTAVALVSMLAIPKRLGKNRSKADLAAMPASYRKLTVVLALLALFLFQGGNMALAAFIIRLGEHAHLARDFIGQALGWATWIGAAGAGLVIFMGTRFGRLRPLIAAFLLTFAGTAGFFWSESQPIFMIANVGTAITWSFVVPYLFGMISRLDPSGRLAALGGFVSKCGLASGPLLAGLLLRTDNFDLLIWVSLIALALSSIAAFAAARQVDQLEPAT